MRIISVLIAGLALVSAGLVHAAGMAAGPVFTQTSMTGAAAGGKIVPVAMTVQTQDEAERFQNTLKAIQEQKPVAKEDVEWVKGIVKAEEARVNSAEYPQQLMPQAREASAQLTAACNAPQPPEPADLQGALNLMMWQQTQAQCQELKKAGIDYYNPDADKRAEANAKKLVDMRVDYEKRVVAAILQLIDTAVIKP